MKLPRVLIRGGGDLASAVIQKLHNSGFPVIVSEIERPRMVRRTVSFANAVYESPYVVEGLTSVLATPDEVEQVLAEGNIPVVVLQEEELMKRFQPEVFIDATLSKKAPNYAKAYSPLVIGLGPEIVAGEHAHVVIETDRGHNLARLIFEGKAAENTHVPGTTMGYSTERVLRSPADGTLETEMQIGDLVTAGQTIGYVGGEEVRSQINGVIRGLIHPSVKLHRGMKIGDVDPRMKRVYCDTISDKGRALAGAVLEAIMIYLKSK